MERGRGTFIRTKSTGGTVAPSRFERLEQSTDARELNLLRYREAGQARRRRPTIEEVIQKSREKRVLESGFGSESDSSVAKAILFLVITGSTAGIIACGGGESADNPTNTDSSVEPSPSNTLVVTATLGETPEVTPIPPTEAPLWGPAPTIEDLSAAIDKAIEAFGTSSLPDPLQSVEVLNRHLGWCNEQGLEEVAPELYANSVINGCTAIGQELTAMFEKATVPSAKVVIMDALIKCRDYTIGDGGKVDQLNAEGKPGIGSGKFYKLDLLETYFTPGK